MKPTSCSHQHPARRWTRLAFALALTGVAACGGDASLKITIPPTRTPGAEATSTAPVPPTSSRMPTRTATQAASPTRTATVAATVTRAATASPTRPVATATASATAPRTATATPSVTRTTTTAPSPTVTTVPTVAATASVPPTASATATPTETPTPLGPSLTPTATLTPSETPTVGPSATPTATLAPSDTPTVGPSATSTATPTPSPTPTESAATCGNGFLENGETCATCAPDCAIAACTDAGTDTTVRVNFTVPLGEMATSATVLVGYRSAAVSIPGSGLASSVSQRVQMRPSGASFNVNDLDYALRAVVNRNAGLSAGRLFTILFDNCQGVPPPNPADFGCTVEGCAGMFGTIQNCGCAVAAP